MTLDDYLNRHYQASTAKLYAFEISHYLQRIGGEQRAEMAGYTDLVNYLESLRQTYKNPATINRILYSIKSYYRYLVASGHRSDFPGANLKIRDKKSGDIQVQDLLTGDELKRLLEPRNERYKNLETRNQVVMGLLVHQGLMVREITALLLEDLQLEKGTVYVRSSNKTNGRKLKLESSQILPLHRYINAVKSKISKGKIDQLILTSRGTAESGEGIHYLIETLRLRVPQKRLTPTLIRQSVIAEKLKNGMDLRHAQAFAGHRKPSTTEKYRQTNLEELCLAVNQYHPLGNHFNH